MFKWHRHVLIASGQARSATMHSNGSRRGSHHHLGDQAEVEQLESRTLLAAVSWDGGAGTDNWHDPANWSNDQVPTISDDVTIDVASNPTIVFNSTTGTRIVNSLLTREAITFSGGSLTVLANATFESLVSLSSSLTLHAQAAIQDLYFSNGVLTGSGDFTITGSFTWTAGTMSGSGRTIIDAAGSLTLGNMTMTLGRILENNGTATWGGGSWFFSGGTFINNGSFLAINSSSNFAIAYGYGGTNRFDNYGTFTKAGAGAIAFSIYDGNPLLFNNTFSGSVHLLGGRLHLDAGGTHEGDYILAATTLLYLNGTHTFSASADITGDGSIQVYHGSSTFNGSVTIGGSATFSGGTSTFNGTLNGGLSLFVHGGTVNLGPSSFVFTSSTLSDGTLTGAGDWTITGLFTWTGGTMAGSGRTTIDAGGSLAMSGMGKTLARVLENNGSVTWTGGSCTLNGVTFTNSGTFFADPRFWNLSGTNSRFDNSGTFTAAGTGSIFGVPFNNTNAGSVHLLSGTLALEAGGTHEGDFTLDAGSLLELRGTHTLSVSADITGDGSIQVVYGSSMFNGSVSIGGSATFNGGTSTFNGSVSIGGSALLVSGGNVNFNAATTFAAGTTLSITNGTANLGPSSFVFASASLSGGSLTGSGDLRITGSFAWTGGGMTGTGRTIIDPASSVAMSGTSDRYLGRILENYGTVTWNGGYFDFLGSSRFVNRGVFTASVATYGEWFFGFYPIPSFENHGVFIKDGSGTANLDYEGGITFVNSATGSVLVHGGTLLLPGGGGTHAGNFYVAANTHLGVVGNFLTSVEITGAGSIEFHHITTTFNGTVSIGGSATFRGSTSTFNGSVSIGGAATFSYGSASFNGTFHGGSTLLVSGGNVNFNAATTFAAGVTLSITNGTANLGPSSFVFASASLSGGTLTGSGDVIITGAFNWTGGTMAGSGRTLIVAPGSLSMTGTGTKTLSRIVQNDGTATWTSGPWSFNGGTFVNRGSFYASSSSGTLSARGDSGTNRFDNNGLFTKSGAGAAEFRAVSTAVFFQNTATGTINILGGTLGIRSGGTSSGVMRITSGSLDVSAGFNFTGMATLLSEPGTLVALSTDLVPSSTNSDLFAPNGTVRFIGGTRSLEVMARDRGATNLGFEDNFAFGRIELASGVTLNLVDGATNSSGMGTEALYVNALVVPAGTTLNLNGKQVYARATQIAGTVNPGPGGSIHLLGDGGSLAFDSPTPGLIESSPEPQADEWTVFGRAGRFLSINLDPGFTLPPPGALGWAEVRVLAPDGSILASADNLATGQGSVVLLVRVELPADGEYRIRVSAPEAQATSSGRYMLTAYDSTVDVSPLPLGSQRTGAIESPYAIDRWVFTAATNAQVRFDLLARSSSSIVFTLSGPNGYTAFTDAGAVPDLLNLPFDGQYTLAVRGLGTATGSYSFTVLQSSVQTLLPGSAITTSVIGTGTALLFEIPLESASPLVVRLNDSNNGNRNEVYLRRGTPPTRGQYDYRYTEAASADHSVLVPIATDGVWYVLIYAANVAGPSDYTVLAATGLRATDLAPDRGPANATTAITIQGAGFAPGMEVTLYRGIETGIPAGLVEVDSYSQIIAHVAIPAGATLGEYTVRISRPGIGMDDLINAFTVLSAGQPRLETRVILPGQLGRHAVATIQIEYANTGTAPMPAPLLVLQSGDPDDSDKPILTLDQSRITQGFWTSGLPEGFSHSIQILASGILPGLLLPGERIQVPAYYAGLLLPWDPFDNDVEFQLQAIEADDKRRFNYEGITYANVYAPPPPVFGGGPAGSVGGPGFDGDPVDFQNNQLAVPWVNGHPPTAEELADLIPAGYELSQRFDIPGYLQSRPDSIDPGAWTLITNNLRASVGETMGGFIRVLSENAQHLARLGQRVVDVSQLWNFEVQQAIGMSPIQTLSSAVDAAITTPGGDLSFGRTFALALDERFNSSIFGRGWSGPWQTRLEAEPDGAVNIIGAGGSRRRFEPDTRYNNTYFALNGDSGVLRRFGDEYQVREQDGSVIRFSAAGPLLWSEDPNGNRITLGYTDNALTSLTHSSGAFLMLAYNAAGLVESITDSAGRTTLLAYDLGNQYLLSSTSPDGQVTTYTYDNTPGSPRQHALTSVTAGGTTRTFEYDARGRLSSTYQTGNAEQVSFTYNSTGRVITSDAAGGTTTFDYDHRGLLGRVVDALGQVTTAEYNSDRRLSRLVDPLGQSQAFTWCSCGSLTSVTNELGNTTSFAYENVGPDGTIRRMTSFTDANGNITRYTYDSRGNLLSTIYPNGTMERIGGYDPTGNPLSFINRRGQTLGYQYNAAGQVSRQTFQNGTFIDFTYDARGNLRTSTEPGNRVTAFDYDGGDRLTRVEYPTGRFLDFTYDQFGRRASMTDQDGFEVNYTYDSAGRLHRLTDSGGGLFVEYLYDAAGRLSRKDNGNGTFTTYEYDAAGQVLSIINRAPDNAINSRFDYTYDVLGRRISMTTLDGAWAYSYDATGQLTRAVFTPPSGSSVPAQDLEYVYDALGNRIRTIENGVTTEYTTNNLNQYTSVGADTLIYDADGNLISRSGPGGNATYTYDQQSRLTRVVTPEGTWEYEYDAFGNRTASTLNGARTEFLLDPTGLVDVVGEYASAGALVARYVHGLGLVTREDGMGAGRAFYDFDAIGNTAAMTDAAGSGVNRYAYSPFGQSLFGSELVSNSFEFVGQFGVQEEENGLQFMRFRYVHGDFGRFVTLDPARLLQGLHSLYGLSNNNPISTRDPLGLYSLADYNMRQAEAIAPLLEVWAGLYAPGDISAMYFGLMGSDSLWVALPSIAVAPVVLPFTLAADSLLYVGNLYGTGIMSLARTLGWPYPPDPTPNPTVPPGGDPSSTGTSNSVDPNALYAPMGFGPENYFRGDVALPYRIEFENYGPGSLNEDGTPVSPDRWASAPAQRVFITNPLSEHLDLSTFRYTGFGFGDFDIALDTPSQSWQQVLTMTYNDRTFEVWFEADLDYETRQLRMVFQSIDPGTELPPDVLTGFLPPEDGTGRGKGFVTYTVTPMAALPTGTEIRNVALISFDGQTFIATNQVDPLNPTLGTDPDKEALVTIDNGRPTATVDALPAQSDSPRFLFRWTSADDALGSGIRDVRIYVSVDEGPYRLWAAGLPPTPEPDPHLVLIGEYGHRYSYYAIATDNVGNEEVAFDSAEASIYIRPLTPDIFTVDDPIVDGPVSPPGGFRPTVPGIWSPPGGGRSGPGDGGESGSGSDDHDDGQSHELDALWRFGANDHHSAHWRPRHSFRKG